MSKIQGLGGQQNNSADAIAGYVQSLNEAIDGMKMNENGTVTR